MCLSSQDRLQEELDGIFGDSDRPITMSDLREMKYTENCIKEALRIYPSVPIIGRELKEDITVGMLSVKGTMFSVIVAVLSSLPLTLIS